MAGRDEGRIPPLRHLPDSKAPAGKEKNWLETAPGRGYFAILRLYGPTETAIDKSWKPGDIEKVQ
jgi:hypothetical protein